MRRKKGRRRALNLIDFAKIAIRLRGMIEKLRSRKFITLIITTLISSIGREVGLTEEAVNWLIGVAGSYIVGQGIADIGRVKDQVVDRLRSVKLWVYVAYTLIVTIGDFLGLPIGIIEKVGAVVMTYLFSQGVADATIFQKAKDPDEAAKEAQRREVIYKAIENPPTTGAAKVRKFVK